MKASVIFLVFIALASATYMTSEKKYADEEFLKKQKVIFEVFANVWQPEIHNSYFEEAKNFNYVDFKDKITSEDAYTCFADCFEDGFLDMDEIYSPMLRHHNHQMLSLFKVFYYAKDWDTFYHFFVWARFNINPGMFIQAVTMTILHRNDFAGLILPAVYEISPFYFFNSYVTTKTRQIYMQGVNNMDKVDNVPTYTVRTNYTSYYYDTNQEAKLAYFMEDVGLNSYYYYYNMDYYAWLGGDEYGLKKDRRGEWFMYQIRQFLARYYLERLSNGLGEIPEINFWHEIETGYYSTLMFYNGVNFPTRTNNYMMYLNADNARYLDHLYGLERRVFDAIDSGFFLMPNGEKKSIKDKEGIEYLGNLIQRNKDSMGNFYFYGMLETFYRKLLSGSFDSMDAHERIPGVLELFETSMRDPMFYVFYKRISTFYDAYVNTIPPWKKSDLEFDGVKFTSVEMDKLLTYFDLFTADITNVIDVPKDTKDNIKSKVLFKAQVPRLNYVPFTVHIKVNSVKAQKAVMMMYVGPKYDSYGNELSFNENRNNFWELDRWIVDLVEGENAIDRASEDFTWFVEDRTTYYELYKKVMTSLNSHSAKFPLDMTEAHCGFPSRLMLPRGRVGGYPVKFFFMLIPYTAPKTERFTGFDPTISCGVGSGARYIDDTPFGFPFNKKFEYHFKPTDNMYSYDTLIYHKMGTEYFTYY